MGAPLSVARAAGMGMTAPLDLLPPCRRAGWPAFVSATPPTSAASERTTVIDVSACALSSSEAAALSFLMMAAILIIVLVYIRVAGTEAFMGDEDEETA